MILEALFAFVVAYLPGAVLFRLPVADRARRAALPAEERLFWHVVISLACSLAIVLVLASMGAYTLNRLIAADSAVIAVALGVSRGNLSYGREYARLSSTALLPVILIAIGIVRFFPSSEYVIGGKDPGGYINEGVLIATRGSLVLYEADVAALKSPERELFFNSHGREEYFDNRFMGFFLQDPDTGQVVGQFPHLYPASIAIAYDLAGIKAALGVVGLWAMLGVVAVYLAGARLIGRPAAFAAGVLLSLNLAEVFFSKYPNTEVVMQALLFAALLAIARAHQDDDRFFAPVAGVLAALLIFVRIDALLAIAAIGLALILAWLIDGRKPRLAFLAPLAIGAVVGWFYWSGPMRASFWRPLIYLRNLPPLPVAIGLVALVAALLVAAKWRHGENRRAKTLIPWALAIALVVLAIYAWWLRVPGGKLADHDAATFRTFVQVYFFSLGMIATLIGIVTVAPRHFWRDPALILTASAFGIFLFFKLQVWPEHLWLARRFVPVILPSALLFASAAALGTGVLELRRRRVTHVAVGAIVLVILGQQYRLAAESVVPHAEFKGLVQHVAELAAHVGERDLVIVESRDAGDVHVLGIPLAYIHGRHVLVLETSVPDKTLFERFLADALVRYERVLFLGGGGTDLLSAGVRATPVTYVPRAVPSFLVTPWNAYRAGIRQYKFDYSLYRLDRGPTPSSGFALDVGFEDDLQVVRFGDKELGDARTFRWTSAQSFIAVRGLTGREHEIALVMHDGGRPAGAAPAAVDVALGDMLLGRIAVGFGFREYTLPVPPEAIARAIAAPGRQLRLTSTTWKPSQFSTSPDNRDLGVMVDRVEIR